MRLVQCHVQFDKYLSKLSQTSNSPHDSPLSFFSFFCYISLEPNNGVAMTTVFTVQYFCMCYITGILTSSSSSPLFDSLCFCFCISLVPSLLLYYSQMLHSHSDNNHPLAAKVLFFFSLSTTPLPLPTPTAPLLLLYGMDVCLLLQCCFTGPAGVARVRQPGPRTRWFHDSGSPCLAKPPAAGV